MRKALAATSAGVLCFYENFKRAFVKITKAFFYGFSGIRKFIFAYTRERLGSVVSNCNNWEFWGRIYTPYSQSGEF
jgi:hypothetical protein